MRERVKMPMSDQYRRKVEQITKEIAQTQAEKSREIQKRTDLYKRINTTSASARNTKNQSLAQSKTREVERLQRNLESIEKKISQLESKLSRKQSELGSAHSSLTKEEDRALRKRQRDDNRLEKKQSERLKRMDRKLTQHDSLHRETRKTIQQLQELPEKIAVLFLAANPMDQEQLRLDEEVRAIDEMIRKSEHRDSVQLVSKWAVRPPDILQALNQHKPQIVHFSGHGSAQDEIVFLNDQGGTKLVSKDAIVQLMMATSEGIRIVFFNTCYSRGQAEAVVGHVEAAIGMSTSIGDEAARVFSSQFYSAIGFGLTVQKSFDQAKALLMMEGIAEENTPELFVQVNVDPDQIIIVKPPGT